MSPSLPRPLRIPLRVLYTGWAFLWFILLMLLVFPFILLATFFGKHRGGDMINHILRVWSGIWFVMVGIRHRNVYDYRPDPSSQYIFVHNHISYLDAAIAVESVRQPFRALGKMEMRHYPVFGYIYSAFVVMVNRGDAEDRARSIRDLKDFIHRGISIMIFPEGTFNETGGPLKPFFDGAFRIAIETGTPILPVVFLDAYERMHFHHIFSLTPGRSRAVFLDPVPVEGLTMDDVKHLKEKVYGIMEGCLRARADRFRT